MDDTKHPYKCKPEDQTKKCQLWFEIDPVDDGKRGDLKGYIENQCKCSLGSDQEKNGHCSLMIGTEEYQNAARAMQTVLSNSNCHTNDRANVIAQKDPKCGIGSDSDEWRFYVD